MAANKLQAGVIKNSGTLEANSLVSKGGKIYLEGDEITLSSTSKIEAKGPTGGGTSGANKCTTVHNTLTGSAKITEVEDTYIKLGKTKVTFSKCTQFTFNNGLKKLKQGETVTWTGDNVGGSIIANSITVAP